MSKIRNYTRQDCSPQRASNWVLLPGNSGSKKWNRNTESHRLILNRNSTTKRVGSQYFDIYDIQNK